MKRMVFYTLNLSIMMSCHIGASKKMSGADGDTQIHKNGSLKYNISWNANSCDVVPDRGEMAEIQDGDFVSSALSKDMNISRLDSCYGAFGRRDKFTKNTYIDGAFDTTRSYKVDCDTAAVILSRANSFPLYASIRSDKFALAGGRIHIGMSKDDFFRRIGKVPKSEDAIRVIDDEGNNIIEFFFVNGNLVKFVYLNLYVE